MATEKQKRFAKLIANGCDEDNNPVTATDAYTLSGYKELFPRNAQHVEACRLMSSDTVMELIETERAGIAKIDISIETKERSASEIESLLESKLAALAETGVLEEDQEGERLPVYSGSTEPVH